jgi:hypothetical protein
MPSHAAAGRRIAAFKPPPCVLRPFKAESFNIIEETER